MPAPKGHPRYGGRQKGTLNKNTRDLFALCDQQGINPFEALLKFSTHEDPSIAMNALKEVCQYLYPKRKSLEHSGEIDRRLKDLPNEELLARLPEAVKILKKAE